MAAAQPLNTAITVHRRVRSYRDISLHRSVFQTFQRINPQLMSVPGEEVLVTETRDNTVVTDTSLGGRSGLPVVRFLAPVTTLESGVENVSGLNFPVRIGQDAFLEKSAANVTDDLHADLRAA